MELEGLKRCRAILDGSKVAVSHITTDRHIQINKYIANHWQEVTHLFDLWHIAKSMFYVLDNSTSCKLVRIAVYIRIHAYIHAYTHTYNIHTYTILTYVLLLVS